MKVLVGDSGTARFPQGQSTFRRDDVKRDVLKKRDNFIQNDEWQKQVKTKLDVELFEMHMLGFGSCG